MEILIISISCYILGSIPFGFILTKIFLKKDIRDIGSGNIGATNALRTGNKFLGYGTLILDILKAVIPIIYIKLNFIDLIYIASLSVFLGHVFPIWLKFNGGKGIATYIGILFSINYIYGLLFIIILILLFLISKYSSLSSIIASSSIPIYILFYKHNFWFFYLIIFILIIYSHRENIKRLINNEETKTKIY